VECVINFAFVYYKHILDSPVAPLIGFSGALLTLAKTFLYFFNDYFCGFCHTKHNTMVDYLLVYVLPNGLWILFPALITYRLGKDLASTLVRAEQQNQRIKSK